MHVEQVKFSLMGESFIEQEIAAHRARNEKLLEIIERHGADQDATRPIDFFFYTGDQDAASALARDLEVSGFVSVQVSDEPRNDQWCVQAVRMDSVAAITEEAFVERVVSLAAKHLVAFDGWGTPI